MVVPVARADALIRKGADSLLSIVLQHAFNGAGSCISGVGSLSITLCGKMAGLGVSSGFRDTTCFMVQSLLITRMCSGGSSKGHLHN